MKSVFENFQQELFPHRFAGTLHVPCIAGGTPTDPNVAEGWLKKKLGGDDDALLRQQVAEIMVERGVTAEEAAELIAKFKHLNGFKRDAERGGELYIEGRQLKAALKEAASCAVAAGKLDGRGWGKTNKGLLSYLAEHVFVMEDRLYLGATKATRIEQRFIANFRGSSIQYEEVVEDAHIDFTVASDHDFTRKQWAAIWTLGEQQGIGSSRSQGFGRYSVIRWDKES